MSSSQHLSSQSQTESLRNQKILQCHVCRSTNFDDDDDTGFMICNDCGTQLLEYTQESFALEDGNIATKVNGRLNFKKLTSRQRIKADVVLPGSYDIDLNEFLIAYQYSLKYLTEQLAIISDLNNTNELLNEVKSLWLLYLNAFRKNDVNMTSLLLHTNTNKNIIFKYIPPSGILLLGFLYYACRLLRLWITPADLVKWCMQGDLPYYRLFSKLPDDKKKMLANNSKYMFQLEVLSPTLIFYHTVKISEMIGKAIPPLNTPLIAKTYIIGLGLPLEVWDIYVKLSCMFRGADPFYGLESWKEQYPENIMASIIIACKFCRWTEWSIATANEAIKTNYTTSNLVSIRSRHSNISKSISIANNESIVPLQIPLSINELDYITRKQLPSLLQKIKSVLLLHTDNDDITINDNNNINKKKRRDINRSKNKSFRGISFKGEDIFNDPIKTVLQTMYKNGNSPEIPFGKIFENNNPASSSSNSASSSNTRNKCWKVQETYSSDAHISPVFLNGGQIANSKLIPCKKGDATAKSAIEKVKQLNNGESFRSHRVPYILYANDNAIPGTVNDRNINNNTLHNSSSTEGSFHVQYLVLLERFARYLRTSPNLLHKLVDQYETQIFGLLNPKDIDKPLVNNLGTSYAFREVYDSSSFFPDIERKNVDPSNVKTYDDLDGFKFSDNINVMPILKQLGINILHKKDDNDDDDNDDDDSSDSDDSST